jgi:hypothetical protein
MSNDTPTESRETILMEKESLTPDEKRLKAAYARKYLSLRLRKVNDSPPKSA